MKREKKIDSKFDEAPTQKVYEYRFRKHVTNGLVLAALLCSGNIL